MQRGVVRPRSRTAHSGRSLPPKSKHADETGFFSMIQINDLTKYQS